MSAFTHTTVWDYQRVGNQACPRWKQIRTVAVIWDYVSDSLTLGRTRAIHILRRDRLTFGWGGGGGGGSLLARMLPMWHSLVLVCIFFISAELKNKLKGWPEHSGRQTKMATNKNKRHRKSDGGRRDFGNVTHRVNISVLKCGCSTTSIICMRRDISPWPLALTYSGLWLTLVDSGKMKKKMKARYPVSLEITALHLMLTWSELSLTLVKWTK